MAVLRRINHKAYYDGNDAEWHIDWSEFVDHAYCIHSSIDTSRMDGEISRVGLADSGIFSYFNYDVSFDAAKTKHFKSKATIDALTDAIDNGYGKVLIITDDVRFASETTSRKILSKTMEGDIVLLNNNDVCCDCFIMSSKAMESICAKEINFSDPLWKERIRKEVSEDASIVGMAVSVPMCVHCIDYVITYVDGTDNEWSKVHDAYSGKRSGGFDSVNRYRSWDNLQYVFRGIGKHMLFVDRVYLVVSSESQVPDWIDRENVEIVLHGDIIPKELLPTFNSCTIEMFLGNIKGISEYFIYGNDDVFPTGDVFCDHNYSDGKPKMNFSRLDFNPSNSFHKQCRNSCEMAARDVGVSYVIPIRQSHGNSPMLRSAFLHLNEVHGDDIIGACTRFRDGVNINQYVFTLFNNYYYGLPKSDITLDYFQCERDNEKAVMDIVSGNSQYVCLNDNSSVSGKEFERLRDAINGALEKRLPWKSKFEK